MASTVARITKRLVDSLKCDGTDQCIRDTNVLGFAINMSPAGLLTYTLRYRFEGRQRKYKIGVHGAPWTPDTARAEAQILWGKISKGVDPQQEKTGLRADVTVAELGDAYLLNGLCAAKESSIAQARRNIENHIKPLIGARRASSLTRDDVRQLLRDVAAGRTQRTRKTGPRGLARVTGGRGAASQTVTTLSAMLGYGAPDGQPFFNPTFGVKRFPGKEMKRYLSPDEARRLGEALAAAVSLGSESIYAIAALRLLILTGCRKNEILTVKRSYIDTYHRCLRLPDSKTGAKVVHLGDPALQVIAQIPEIEGNPYLLPGTIEGAHVVNLQKVWARIRTAAALEGVRIHDLRHSFVSFGATAGESLLIIGGLLGHRSSKTTEKYKHLADHPLKTAAQRITGAIAEHLGKELPQAPADETNHRDPFATFWALEPEEKAAPANPVLGAVIRTRWVDTRAAAVMLGYKAETIHNYRSMGIGPAFRKVGRRVVYAPDALKAWQAVQIAGRSTAGA